MYRYGSLTRIIHKSHDIVYKKESDAYTTRHEEKQLNTEKVRTLFHERLHSFLSRRFGKGRSPFSHPGTRREISFVDFSIFVFCLIRYLRFRHSKSRRVSDHAFLLKPLWPL